MRRANGGRYVPPGSTKREPITKSASPARIGPRSFAELGGVVLPVPVQPDGDLVPLVPRVPEPRLDRAADADVEGQREHRRAVGRATAAVSSCDASSTTTTSMRGSKARISSTTPPIAPASFHAGTIATSRPSVTRRPRPRARRARAAVARDGRTCARRARARGRAAPSPPPAPDRRRARGTRRRPPRRSRRARARGRLEPALDARRAGSRRSRRRRTRARTAARSTSRDGRVRSPGHVEVDACRRDRTCEEVERDVADRPRRPVSPWKSRPPSAKSSSGARREGSPTIVFIQSRRNLSP